MFNQLIYFFVSLLISLAGYHTDYVAQAYAPGQYTNFAPQGDVAYYAQVYAPEYFREITLVDNPEYIEVIFYSQQDDDYTFAAWHTTPDTIERITP